MKTGLLPPNAILTVLTKVHVLIRILNFPIALLKSKMHQRGECYFHVMTQLGEEVALCMVGY